jgi:hydroxymethylpyrimidine/phosphomethylpyrimidine kinase
MNATGIKRVLTIAGSDSGGGAGIQADLKTMTVLGAYGMSVVTAVTAQNTQGVQDIHVLPPEFVGRQFDAVASDIGIDALKTGMLADPEIVRVVAAKIRVHQITKTVFDPVLEAKGGVSLMSKNGAEIFISELFPLALVVTPNIPEAEILTGRKISSLADMKKAAEAMHRSGAKNVVVKGGHAEGDPVDLLFDGENFFEFRSRRLNTTDTHGTGCTFSSAIAVGLADALTVPDAVERAKRFVFFAIESALRIGKGHGPVNAMAFREREIR